MLTVTEILIKCILPHWTIILSNYHTTPAMSTAATQFWYHRGLTIPPPPWLYFGCDWTIHPFVFDLASPILTLKSYRGPGHPDSTLQLTCFPSSLAFKHSLPTNNKMAGPSLVEMGTHHSQDILNIKMPSYQYRDSHVKDNTVSPTVLSLTWEFPYLGKTVLYWDGAH